MRHKSRSGALLKAKDSGVVQVLFATLNTIDHDGDVTLPGAFKQGQEVRISAYNHASWGPGALPVGKGSIRETGDQAIFDGQFFLETTAGNETFQTVKAMGDLQEWSYGYDLIDVEPGQLNGQRVQFIKATDVYEVSPVLLGAGIGTRTLSAKSRGGKQLDSEIEQQLNDAARARYGTANTFAFLVDHDDDLGYAYFCVCDTTSGADRTVQVPFTRDAGGVTLGQGEQEVEATVSYEPAANGTRTSAKGRMAGADTNTEGLRLELGYVASRALLRDSDWQRVRRLIPD